MEVQTYAKFILVVIKGMYSTYYILLYSMIAILVIVCMFIPYSGIFSRGKIFTNFADWPQFANIFPLKLYRCMVIY